MIANNIVDGAAVGISVTNFDVGGRLAVVQGNLLRNLGPVGPGQGVGLTIEADSVVTGNVIESAPLMAAAMKQGVEAGRAAFLAGRIDRKPYASASSPTEGVPATARPGTRRPGTPA